MLSSWQNLVLVLPMVQFRTLDKAVKNFATDPEDLLRRLLGQCAFAMGFNTDTQVYLKTYTDELRIQCGYFFLQVHQPVIAAPVVITSNAVRCPFHFLLPHLQSPAPVRHHGWCCKSMWKGRARDNIYCYGERRNWKQCKRGGKKRQRVHAKHTQQNVATIAFLFEI